MSGICGIFYLDGKPVAADTMDAMMEKLSHRGPDGSGVWREGPVGLGHQMLHTTPESLHETLPLKNASSDLVITADARIDNRDELFDSFYIPHPERAAIPDSTLILKAYEKWGEECPKHLLGDFAFAIWDRKKQQLFCARDHIGVKALYYHYSPRVFAFASEIKGVLAVPDVPHRLNEIAVADFLVYNHEDLEITFYKEILRLPPARILVLRNEKLKILRYWAPELGAELRLSSDEEYAEALRERMFQAVHCRMRSAFPVGVKLSGGLDSSSVACIAARWLREKGKRLIGVSSVLPENHAGIEKDEREYIEEVRAQEHNIDVKYVLAEGATPFDDLEGWFRRMDQPVGLPFCYMSEALCAAARKHGARILLTGFGGDMTASFNSKGYMAQLARTGHWLELARLVCQCAAIEKLPPWRILKREVLSILAPSFLLRINRRLKGNREDFDSISHSAINPGFARRVNIKERCRNGGDSLESRVPPDARAVMLTQIGSPMFSYGFEYMSTHRAMFGLEQLHPLLDKRIIDFCLTVPPAQFVRSGWRRSLIRHALGGVLPAMILWRTGKNLFSPDYYARMLMARPWVLHFLSETYADNRPCPYVDRDKIERQLNSMRPAKRWNELDDKIPIIVGRGVEIVAYERWHTLNRHTLEMSY